MRAHWIAKSLQPLQQIRDHIALDQPLNANRFVDRLTRRAETIALQPRAGRIVPEERELVKTPMHRKAGVIPAVFFLMSIAVTLLANQAESIYMFA